ncbi:MAG TPA: hypothetical protein VHB79_04370 [Polyangiaceae bacterium]|nr:hypothetical protein [Polyangiaceae bacterium]
MQLIFRTRSGAIRLDWCQYALFRDNVQHYLESGPGQKSFAALHAIERAVDGEPRSVSALELRREIQRAWFALANLTLAQSAVSLRTHAILTGCDPPCPFRGTVLAKHTGWSLPVVGDEDFPLRLYLAGFVAALLTITEQAATSDHVSVKSV